MFRVIEKAIIDSDLGIMPENNGEIIRIGIPPLMAESNVNLDDVVVIGYGSQKKESVVSSVNTMKDIRK